MFFRKDKSYWVGKDSLKTWRRIYLELFDNFVDNCDIQANITLPLNPSTLSKVYEPSVGLSDNKKFSLPKSSSKNGMMTVIKAKESYDFICQLLSNSEKIFKLLKLSNFELFHCSLLDLKSIIEEFINEKNSVKCKTGYDKLEQTETINPNEHKMEIDDTVDSTEKIDKEIKTDDRLKEKDVTDKSHEDEDKHDDSDSTDNKLHSSTCLTWVFNEDITCIHGEFIILV